MTAVATEPRWAVRLFRRSVLKQRKLAEITRQLGAADDLDCLDIGADNGVVSYLLRQRGGRWTSADLDPLAVASIRDLIGEGVYQIDGRRLPFDDDRFDRVVIVDFLEHIETDREFAHELHRVLRPGGELIVNVPYVKHSLLRRLRLALGQTDEKHGHVRPGYTIDGLRAVLGDGFELMAARTYSKFFSELIDTGITFGFGLLKSAQAAARPSQKGVIVTGQDMKRYAKLFWIYSAIYPVVWCVAQLDRLLPFASGYMLIARARSRKRANAAGAARRLQGMTAEG